MTNYISLDMDRISVTSSSVVSPLLETSTYFSSPQLSTRNNLPYFCSEENLQSRRIQHEGCIGASERIGRVRDQNETENETSDSVECRICQEEDKLCHLEIPCSCRGSMKYAHHRCVQHWCNEKGNATCEICNQPYESGYVVSTRPTPPNDVPSEFRGEWAMTGIPQNDFHVLAIAAAQEYGEFAAVNASAAACCRSATFVLVAILLLRHAFAMASARGYEDVSTFFALFLLRAAGFLLPCYIMARIMNILHRRRLRQDIPLATAEVAVLLRGGQNRELLFAVPRGPP
ncbi:hypothetical protein O6H91_01G149800 [Diphasiastrum complanatum]|uniref:Uncharacterized protein n=3 Tax=Diphasiastrum complanatum TaxID=34168 RepID=A0ACC2EX97_DIPCM|nr:hypothetical protein O6H91_01G087900 [Diphasiastrum complanatum]KAJ7571122.1 hypothetical protein O6H91_01G149800 [Diphasiastrum complanatum]KAJ7571123.1 hypothetical protein O6H91_01G149800 [Diphasiastrum complanatum]